MIINYNIKKFFLKKNFLTQKVISYFYINNLNSNLYFNYILYKNLLFILLKLYLNDFNLKYIYFLYSFLNFLKYNIIKDIIFLFNNKILIKKNINYLNFNNNLIKYKILKIRKTSKTTKRGQNKKFNILTASGNSTGWVGIGQGKDINFITAVDNSYKNSLKNIYFFDKNFFNNLNYYDNTFIKFKASKLLVKPHFNFRNGIKSSIYLQHIFELAGYNNITTKRLGSSNKLNIINALLKKLSKQKNNLTLINNNYIKNSSYFINLFKII
uniref:30S ribosomal protein S5 n=1 Tax=Nephromyces sp. ex Molgula occidentalis TaxID=2544991 RepID=A0A5C1H7K2_9APIC|nr:30S ribosomal protein S5 [Nephromyces sp. ex Molgula occidentalis]